MPSAKQNMRTCEISEEKRLLGLLPEGFEVYKVVGQPVRYQVSGSLDFHCLPAKKIYREAKTGTTKIEALKNMLVYLKIEF